MDVRSIEDVEPVVEHNGTLYFGSIGEDTVGRFSLQ